MESRSTELFQRQIAADLNTSKVVILISDSSYRPMDYDGITGEISIPEQKNHQLVVLQPVNPGSKLKRPLHTASSGFTPKRYARADRLSFCLVSSRGRR